jgi:hypothetical protein
MKMKIYCPKCSYEPKTDDRWICKCQFIWNTFDTAAKCPSCGYQWLETQCPGCSQWSLHVDWYHVEDDVKEQTIRSIAIKEVQKITTLSYTIIAILMTGYWRRYVGYLFKKKELWTQVILFD